MDFFKEAYGTDIPLIVDEKGRYYIPKKIFCDVLSENSILINTPSVGVMEYIIHKNKDGSMWINGENISKYYFTNGQYKRIRRLFLNKEMINKINE